MIIFNVNIIQKMLEPNSTKKIQNEMKQCPIVISCSVDNKTIYTAFCYYYFPTVFGKHNVTAFMIMIIFHIDIKMKNALMTFMPGAK